jgi:hypothetical protein
VDIWIRVIDPRQVIFTFGCLGSSGLHGGSTRWVAFIDDALVRSHAVDELPHELPCGRADVLGVRARDLGPERTRAPIGDHGAPGADLV